MFPTPMKDPCSSQYPGWGPSHTLGTAWAPAASWADARASDSITGGPSGAVAGAATVYPKEASRTGYRKRWRSREARSQRSLPSLH